MTAALQSLHETHQARFGEGPGEPAPLDYGDFPGEVEAIRHAVGVLDLEACGVIVVRGPDAAEFLAGLTTNDVKRLPEGRAQPDLLCATKGKILYDVTVVRVQPQQYLLVTQPGELEGVAGHLDAYLIREQVEIGRVPLVRLDLLGPQAAAALTALGHDPAAPVGSFREAPLLALGLPLGPLPRLMVLLPAPHAEAWVQGLLSAVPAARLVGLEAWEEMRVRAGVPRFGVDFDREHLPAEAALYDHISFNKGCYVGQEVHARLHHRGHVNRKLCALIVPEAAAQGLQPGAELFAEGRPVGRLTSLTRLAVDGERRGIALVRWETLQAGTPLASAPEGSAVLRPAALATDLGVTRA